MPELRISLTPDEYELLQKAKGDKTWKQWLLDIAMEQVRPENIAINEINRVFQVLKEKMLVYAELDEVVEVVERMRVVCINLVKLRGDKEKQLAAVITLNQALKEAIAQMLKLLAT